MVFTKPSDWTPLYEPYGRLGSKKNTDGVYWFLTVRDLGSLNAALDEVASPLDTSRVSLELHHVLASLGILEPHDTTVTSHEHHARARFNLFTGKSTNSTFWHSLTSS